MTDRPTITLTLHTFASDDDNGTQARVFATEEGAETALIEAVGQEREDFDAWLADNPDGDVFEFASEHSDYLDTYNIDEERIELPLPAIAEQLVGADPAAKVDMALALLIEARELIKAAGNKQTAERIRAAISSCRGARRIQSYRASRRELLDRAEAICKAQEGYGTPAYRGDPLEAVALQQQAARL